MSSPTKTTFELDTQHAPSSSSRVGFGWYPRSASTRIDSYRHCGIRVLACVVCSCEVCASACVFSSRLCCAASLRGFVARLFTTSFAALLHDSLPLFVASLCGSSRLPCAALAILPLKPVAKAWSLGLLFGRYLHHEGIVMDHIVIVGVPNDLGLHL